MPHPTKFILSMLKSACIQREIFPLTKQLDKQINSKKRDLTLTYFVKSLGLRAKKPRPKEMHIKMIFI